MEKRAPQHFSGVAIEKRAFESPSTTVANFTDLRNAICTNQDPSRRMRRIKILCDFQIQKDQLISARKPDEVIISKKKKKKKKRKK